MKHQIDKHRGQKETLFFDWLMTSMDSVIEILTCRNINTILNNGNITRDPKNPTHGSHSHVTVSSLDFCVSIHDVSQEFKPTEIREFIDKYKRRYNRLIEYIKSAQKLYFVRTGHVSAGDQSRFIKAIQKINPKCDFALVVIDNTKTNGDDECVDKMEHCLYIKINIAPPTQSDWTHSHWDFPRLFSIIESNI